MTRRIVFVTGGAGFIGSNVVAALNEKGRNDLVVCDWLGERERVGEKECDCVALGVPLPDGAVGEIAIRGAMVTTGYWRNPQATADAIRDGWLHTGDAGIRDAITERLPAFERDDQRLLDFADPRLHGCGFMG